MLNFKLRHYPISGLELARPWREDTETYVLCLLISVYLNISTSAGMI